MPIMNFSPSLGIQVEEFIMAMYHDRGDPADWDFTKADFTIDGVWHDLDLSAIVPEAAANHIVHLRLCLKERDVNSTFMLRTQGNVNDLNTISNAAAVPIADCDAMILLSGARMLSYKVSGDYSNIDICIRGWVTD